MRQESDTLQEIAAMQHQCAALLMRSHALMEAFEANPNSVSPQMLEAIKAHKMALQIMQQRTLELQLQLMLIKHINAPN